MSDVVARGGGRVAAHVGRVEPVVVVVEASIVEIAAVLLHDGRMVELHAGVDVGDDDVLAPVAEGRPDIRRADVVDVPFDRVDLGLVRAGDGLGDLVRPVGEDLLDRRIVRQVVQDALAGGHLDRVHDPERLVLRACLLQESAQARLALLRGLLELVDDERAALVPVADLRDLAEICLVSEDYPERRFAVGVDLVDDLLLDLVVRSRRRRRRCVGRGACCKNENRQQENCAQRPSDRPMPALYVHPKPLSVCGSTARTGTEARKSPSRYRETTTSAASNPFGGDSIWRPVATLRRMPNHQTWELRPAARCRRGNRR